MKPYTENQLKAAASAASLEVMSINLSESEQRHAMFIKGARFSENEFLTEVCHPIKAEIDRLKKENEMLKDKIVKLTE